MMIIVSKEVLEYHRIFCKRELTPTEKIEMDHIVLYFISNLPVQKIFLYGSTAHGIPNYNSDYDFLVVIDTDETTIQHALEKHCDVDLKLSRPVHTLIVSLDGFSKRCSQPTDMEFYIVNFGYKLYDTLSLPKVKARNHTAYASAKHDLMYLLRYNIGSYEYQKAIVRQMLHLFVVIKGHQPINEKCELNVVFEYAILVANAIEKELISAIDQALLSENIPMIMREADAFHKYIMSMQKASLKEISLHTFE